MSYFYDLLSQPNTLKKEDILKMITQYKIPPYPKNNSLVKRNCGIEEMPDKIVVKYAITINKSIIKSFPTNRVFKKDPQDKFNRLNLTALSINSSIIVLNYSLDKKWAFIISEIYIGWIETKKFLLVDFKVFWQNLCTNEYLTIIEPLIIYHGYYLDMGTKLKYIKTNEDIKPLLYTKKGYEEIDIHNSSYVLGYLPFTKNNIYIQALKYLDFPYNLGDDLNRIDCSTFIRNICLTCGLKLPRDTKDIYKYLLHDKCLFPNSSFVQILHFKGHIALYLFTIKNRHYIIHANSKNMKVTIDYLAPATWNICDIRGISHIKEFILY